MKTVFTCPRCNQPDYTFVVEWPDRSVRLVWWSCRACGLSKTKRECVDCDGVLVEGEVVTYVEHGLVRYRNHMDDGSRGLTLNGGREELGSLALDLYWVVTGRDVPEDDERIET